MAKEVDKTHPFRAKTNVWLLVLVIFVIIGSVVYWGPFLPPFLIVVFWFIVAFLVAVGLHGYTKTESYAEGTLERIKFQFWGPAATFIVSFFALWLLTPKPQTHNVRVYLKERGHLVTKDVHAVFYISGRDPVTRQFRDGEASVEIPSHLSEIKDVSLKDPGYKLQTSAPFVIADDLTVTLLVIKLTTPPPLPPGAFPSSNIFPDLPTEQQVNQQPAVEPDQVTLHYRNVSNRELTLLICDCSRYYKIRNEKIDGGSEWMTFPLPVSEEYTAFNRFTAGTGWYCFAVRDEKSNNQPVGCYNLFRTKQSWLSIDEEGDEFVATFK